MAAHHDVCLAVKPWDRRAHARNTGRKCEHRATSKGHKATVAKAKQARKAPLPEEA